MFPFTFKLSVPGLSNPFSVPPVTPELPPVQEEPTCRTGLQEDHRQKRPRRRPSPAASLAPPPPLSRKRGWEPSFAEPSRSTTTLASPSGYLDTPAKYREMAGSSTPNDDYHDITMSDTQELPPTKRRRGLAGSIVNTALSAALIGTAVGLTVYRLWRDRGKETPPPPYQQEWIPPAEQPQAVQVTAPTPAPTPIRPRKSRHQVSSLKRPVAHHRRPRVRPHTYTTPPQTSSSALFPPAQPEFRFEQAEEEQGPVEDQMDWIGDKLAILIQEGKRALQSEVVVMSDAKEDEVDDGTGAWEEEEENQPRSSSLSRSSSMKRTGSSKRVAVPPPSSSRGGLDIPSSASSASFVTPRRSHSRGISYENALPSSFQEEPSAWESPELRESMEKARARFLQNRGS